MRAYHRLSRRVNVVVLGLVGVVACSRPPPPGDGAPPGWGLPRDALARSESLSTSLNDQDVGPVAARLGDVGRHFPGDFGAVPADVRPPELPQSDAVLDLLNPAYGGEPNPDLGQALEERLAEFPSSDVANYGVALLTSDELLGTAENDYQDRLCVEPEILLDFLDDDGQRWETSFQVPTYTDFLDDFQIVTATLSSTCESALRADGGDVATAVAAGDCAAEEEQEFFLPDGTCRACVEGNGGDYDACVAASQCEEETVARGWVSDADGNVEWYDTVQARIYACAPDWVLWVTLYVDLDADGTVPDPWDYEHWAYLWIPMWREDLDRVWYYGFDGADGPRRGNSAGEGELGYVQYVRRAASQDDSFSRRIYFARSVEVSHTPMKYHWSWNPGGGAVVVPPAYEDTNGDGVIGLGDDDWGFAYGYGWGVNPFDTRPDGQSKARDFIATTTLKASTDVSGVLVSAANHDRCADGAWEGPDANGAFRCTKLGPPADGWLNDAEVSWMDTAHTALTVFPKITLGSTGLPDPDVPGGYVIHVAGTPALADPEWEGCAWPHQFYPDVATYEDVPGLVDPVPGAVTGNAYRFGKDDLDLRVVLSTNRLRNYCPKGPPE